MSDDTTQPGAGDPTALGAGQATARMLAIRAARMADEKKADNAIVLAVGDVLAITEYFVVASASNKRLVRAVVEAIDDELRVECGRSPLRMEGLSESQWVLADYGDIVVHVFDDETRMYYEIERLYRDVPRIDWQAAETNSGE